MGALKHINCHVGALSLGLFAAALAHAEVPDQDLARLRSLETTLQLERSAADAIRGKDGVRDKGGRALKILAAELRRTDAAILAAASKAATAKAESRANSEFMTLALKLSACHYAGLTLRVAILGMADGRTPARIRSTTIDSTPPIVTDQFAAHIRRCELIERAPPSVRLIGSTCLIDGNNCRESER